MSALTAGSLKRLIHTWCIIYNGVPRWAQMVSCKKRPEIRHSQLLNTCGVVRWQVWRHFVKGISPLGYWQKVNQSPTQTKPYNSVLYTVFINYLLGWIFTCTGDVAVAHHVWKISRSWYLLRRVRMCTCVISQHIRSLTKPRVQERTKVDPTHVT